MADPDYGQWVADVVLLAGWRRRVSRGGTAGGAGDGVSPCRVRTRWLTDQLLAVWVADVVLLAAWTVSLARW